MERKRAGTNSRPESADKELANPRDPAVPLPNTRATSSTEPGSMPYSYSGRPLPSEQERLRLVVGAAKQGPEATPQPTANSGATKSRGRRRQKRVTPRFFAFVACTMLVFLVVSYGVAFWRLSAVEQKILTAASRKEATTARIEQLKDELEKVTGDAYIEEVAREELGLVKPGETAWVLMTPENPDSPFKVEERSGANANAAREGW